jgi:uncharacterized cupin superfamily protein
VSAEIVNVFELAAEGDESDPPGYRARMARFGPAIGATQLGGSVYELDPGQSVCPYHYEFPEEEWLLVLVGRPTLRDPDGEHELAEGDLVLFPAGPDGVHKVTNRTEDPVRIFMFSTIAEAGFAVYPDSDKVNVWPFRKIFRVGDAVDYFDGEA